MKPPTTRSGASVGSRGQSETVGFVLLFGMVLVTAGIVVTFGAAAVTESEERLSADRAEKVLTQMDSEISMVALGRTNSQEIDFDRASGERFSIDEDAGVINITTVGNNSEVIMHDTDLGAVKFERGNTVVAYQGGGVWRSEGSGSSMVSPPEFNYRDQTLTLPLVTVSGDSSLSNGATVEKAGPSTRYFPNATDGFTNPLEDDVVQVTIETDYHRGWKNYFETRTEGDVIYNPDEQLVSVNLTAPSLVDFENGVGVTSSGKDAITLGTGKAEIIGSSQEGIQAPSYSNKIDEKINECESGGCKEEAIDGTLSSGSYYSDSDLEIDDDPTFDTEDGDAEIIIDGDLDITGNTDISISGGGQIRFYVKGDVNIQGTPGPGTNPEDLIMFVHSNATEVVLGGTPRLTGYIYAPNSEFIINGGGNPKDSNLVGGVISETADIDGIVEHKNQRGFQLELETGADSLTFLHISTNPVTVSD